MKTRVNKFLVWDIEMKQMLNWDEIQAEWESEGYFNSVLKQDHYITFPYIQKTDIDGKEIYQGHIIHDTSNYFSEDLIVTYDEMSDSWIDQFGCDYICRALQKGKFRIVGHILEVEAICKTNNKGFDIINPDEIIIPNPFIPIQTEIYKPIKNNIRRK